MNSNQQSLACHYQNSESVNTVFLQVHNPAVMISFDLPFIRHHRAVTFQ